MDVLRLLWPTLIEIVSAHCSERDKWVYALALAIQLAIVTDGDALDPGLAARVVMECVVPMSNAVPMSKIDRPGMMS